nr:WSSV047 [White spot syndrome virus]
MMFTRQRLLDKCACGGGYPPYIYTPQRRRDEKHGILYIIFIV